MAHQAIKASIKSLIFTEYKIKSYISEKLIVQEHRSLRKKPISSNDSIGYNWVILSLHIDWLFFYGIDCLRY